MAGGRPTKYNPSAMLPILEKAAKDHRFIEELPPLLGVSRSTMFDWMDESSQRYNEEFSDSIKWVEACRDAWLVEMATDFITGRQGKRANATVLIFALKNCLGWRDRSDVTSRSYNRNVVIDDGDEPVTIKFGLANQPVNENTD